MSSVLYKFENSVAVLVLNRPESLNAISTELIDDLSEALRRAKNDKARALILTGEGRAFSAGGDIRQMREIAQREGKIEAFLDEPLKKLHKVVEELDNLPFPTIAVLKGIAAGAGGTLAIACNFVIAEVSSSINFAFVKIGLSPDCGTTFFLPRIVGYRKALELLFLGNTLSAEEAFKLGIVNKLVEDGKAMEEAAILASILAEGPTASFAKIKYLISESFKNNLKEQLEREAEMQLESGRSNDFKEGITAFIEKRKPEFSGS